MDPVLFLAQQQQPSPAPAARPFLERFFAQYPPVVSVPVFLLALVAATWVVERVVLVVIRRMTAKTKTKVDDALAEGLPTVLRPLVVLVALHVVVHQFLRSDSDVSKLSPEGELASKALTFLSVVVVALCVTIVAQRVVDAWVEAAEHRRPVGPAIKLGIKVLMVPLALLAALQGIGFEITAFLTALGVGSLAVGLALQDTLKNMFAGIQLVLDRPIRAGDFVEIDRNVKGTVLEIGLRSTKLRSAENNTIILPNSTISNAVVTNLDYADRSYIQRFEIPVAYGTDTRHAQSVLERAVTDAAKEIPALVDEPPRVLLAQLAEIGIVFHVDVRFRQWAGRLPPLSEMHHRLYETLCANGIEIPFPTRVVHLRRDRDAGVTAS